MGCRRAWTCSQSESGEIVVQWANIAPAQGSIQTNGPNQVSSRLPHRFPFGNLGSRFMSSRAVRQLNLDPRPPSALVLHPHLTERACYIGNVQETLPTMFNWSGWL